MNRKMDTDDAPESPDAAPVPAFTVLGPGTAAPQTVPSTAAPPPAAPADPAPGPLNPRSCVTCRRRKVRCDKRMPCTNCRRGHIQCIFPAPGRAPRRPRPRDPAAVHSAPQAGSSHRRESELLERLRKLEGIVEELSGQIEVDRHASTSTSSPEGHDNGDGATTGPGYTGVLGNGGAIVIGDENSTGLAGSTRIMPQPTYEQNASLFKQFGRLVINKGKGRYISSAFWSRVKDEVSISYEICSRKKLTRRSLTTCGTA